MHKLYALLHSKWFWLTAGLTVLAVLYLFDPVTTPFMPQCSFKQITGYNCPGCGFQRAAHAALHGDFRTAIHYNFFLLFALPYLLGLILTEWVWKGKRKEKWQKVLESCTALKFYCIAFIAWGILRNLLHL